MAVVVVTGAAGFVGRAISARVAAEGHDVRALSRTGEPILGAAENIATGDLLEADLAALVAESDAVVHCAARVHVLSRENRKEAERAYFATNTKLPARIAEAARSAGAHHFVQLSSAAALASISAPGETITDNTAPRPRGSYGRSKLAADLALMTLARKNFSVSCLRPPAVYGPGVGAWFARFNRAARAGLPLPLAGVRNQRSFIFSGNVADAVAAAIRRPQSGAWLVTDSAPVSSAELYARLLAIHGHGPRLFALSKPLVQCAGRMALGERADSLLGNAVFSGERFAADFGWTAPTPLDKALELTLGAPPA